MEKISAAVAWRLADRLRGGSDPKQQQSGIAEFVRMDSDGTAWIRIPGNNFDTPVEGGVFVDAKDGDTVTYTISGGQASISGNATSPAVGGTYVAEKVRPVERKADNAIASAEQARTAADMATAEAERAHSAADDAQTSADAAQLSADNAQSSANAAQVSATNANEYASRALGNLSTVQSVAETLAWITQHGTMTLTSDVTPDPTHVYFVVDANGDYTVGSTRYSVVTEPDADDMSTYYELSIDESLNNYVGTHLSVTGDGLWVIPEANGYKILIATGSGSTYTTAGTYIVDGTGGSVAFFRANGSRMGKSGESRLELDYHSMQLIDKDGDTYFHVSDLRDADGKAHITQVLSEDYTPTVGDTFTLSYVPDTDSHNQLQLTLKSGDTTLHEGTEYTVNSTYHNRITIAATWTPPSSPAPLVALYDVSYALSALTFGSRASGSFVGPLSVALGTDVDASGSVSMASGESTVASGPVATAEGTGTTASGNSSHAEGVETVASGPVSHAEGFRTEASGNYSHAEGSNTTASGQFSHTEGVYTTASALYSHAEGLSSTAGNTCTHAEGTNTTASGGYSHAEGGYTTASGGYSHAEGHDTSASGNYSHTQNVGTVAGYDSQTAIGKYNDNDPDTAFEIGNGTADNARSNAFTVDWSGSITSDGSLLKLDNAQGETRTYLQAVEESTLNRTRLGTHRSVNGTDVYNNINLIIDDSGNRSVAVSEVAPWLDMLGITPSDTTMTINTTNTTSIGNNHVRRSGKCVTVQFTELKIAAALANSTTSPTLATIPSGYRPSWNVYSAAIRTANIGSSYWRIDSSGNLTLRNQSDAQIAAGATFAGTVTYVIA